MAAVVVCIAVILGTAVYFFFGSSSKTSAVPKSRPAADQAIKPQTKAVSAPIIQPPRMDRQCRQYDEAQSCSGRTCLQNQPDSSRQSSIQQSVKPSSPPKEKPEAHRPSPQTRRLRLKRRKRQSTPPPPQEPTPIPVTAAAEETCCQLPCRIVLLPCLKKSRLRRPAPPVSAAQPPCRIEKSGRRNPDLAGKSGIS